MIREIRTYGLSETALQERLADLLQDPTAGATLSVYEGHGVLTVTAHEAAMEELTAEITQRLAGYAYSDRGESLSAVVVGLLAAHGLTVATAESCTGGLIAAALTDVPGASRVFGTGVVSYSNDCKKALLAVSEDTLRTDGAVSAATAGQMARGVRRTAGSHLGVSVTGEAGPHPAENHPVGTVFIALADAKRTWVETWHLDGPDRAAIRRQAADSVLWLLWRYLSAYPAVMAGGERHQAAVGREIPRTQGAKHPRLLSRLLPWRGDSRRRLLIKCGAWLVALAVLTGCICWGNHYLSDPVRNQELQASLGDVYWNEPTDLTDGVADGEGYPEGMMPVFRGLYQMNEDVGGWIHIPDSGVDYPVMQYAEGYYRNHNFAKQYSTYGQPYFHGVYPQMMVIYGRNTGNDQMFSELLHYRRVAYLQEHAVVEMNTLTAKGQWQIFAVCVVDDRDTDSFNLTEEPKDYGDFIADLQRRSLFLSDLTVTAEDTLLLLTTNAQNEYGFSGARLVVAARRITGEAEEVTYRVNYRAVMPSAMQSGRGTTRPVTPSTTATTRPTTPSGVVDPDATDSTTTETALPSQDELMSTSSTTRPTQSGDGAEEPPNEDDTTTEDGGLTEDDDSTTSGSESAGPSAETTVTTQEAAEAAYYDKDSYGNP